MKDGEMVVLPAGWTSQSTSSTTNNGGDAAVPSTSGGGGGGNSNGGASHGGIQFSSILLALRRRNEQTWDLAVCTVSAGREYHPTYRQPLQVHEDSLIRSSSFPTCRPGMLLTPHLGSRCIAAWQHHTHQLRKEHAMCTKSCYRSSSRRRSPLLLAKGRRRRALRRRPPPNADRSHAECVLECVCVE